MKRHLLPYLLSVLSFIACSGADSGPAVKDNKLKTEGSFCGEWAAAACNERVVAACNGTRSGCLQTQKSACQVLVPLGYDPTYAEDCIDAVKRAYSDAELTVEELDVVTKLEGACATLVDGGLAEGDPCTSTFECDGVNGYACLVKPGEASGTCQIPEEAETGGSCTAPESTCAEDAYCDGRRCLLREADVPCMLDDACPVDYRCIIATGETEGACTERLDSGTCTANEDCKSGLCLGTTRKVCASNVLLTVESTLCDTLR